ncbi:MAG: hypothetical protein GY854_17790 [Deltaproteobacteria bacterium]|nr:hypothetical protein [Deltaproteobacteria bacterium]
MPAKMTNQGQFRIPGYVFFIVVAVAALVHISTVFYFAAPKIVLGKSPIANQSYDFYVGQTLHFTRVMDTSQKSWSYEPKLFAGAPDGTSIDTNSRAWQLWTYALWKAGVNKSVAFNLFVLLAHLLGPFLVFISARIFGLGRWSALVAGALGYLLWFFDGFFHWCWWSGPVAFAMAGYFALLVVALGFRFVRAPKWWLAALMAATLSVTLLVHTYALLAILPPLIVLYIEAVKKLKTGHHLSLIGALIVAIAVNARWILLGFSFWDPGHDFAELGHGTISHLLTDFLGLTSDTNVSGGIGMRSGFRFLILGAAVITLVLWKREKDDRFRPIAVGLIALFAVAYLGGYIPGLRTIQPYRYVLPALFLAVIPAGQLVSEVLTRGAFRNLPPMARLVGVLIVLAAVPRLARDVVYFVPAFVIEPKDLPEETPHIADIIGFGSIGYPRHRDYRHRPGPASFNKITDGLKLWEEKHGRVLVEYEPLAEHIAWRSGAAVIGGSRLRNGTFAASNFFVRYPKKDPSPKELRRYLETYAVSWVIVMSNPDLGEDDYVDRFEGMQDILKPFSTIWPFRVLRSQLPVSYFQEGSGSVKTSTNKIEVTGTKPEEDIVLKFHWMKTLVCRADCTLTREPVEGDPAGFIRVSAPHPSDFVIVNGY